MAATDLAAKRYAEAALALATEDGRLDEWLAALSQIASYMGEADIQRALENTRVSQDAKQRLLEAGLTGVPRLPMNLARLLVRKGRTALVADIAAQFEQLVEQRQGIARARARTAVQLSEEAKKEVISRLERETGLRILLETEVDPGLIGGAMIQIGDRLVDASTRARLAALRESLVGSLA